MAISTTHEHLHNCFYIVAVVVSLTFANIMKRLEVKFHRLHVTTCSLLWIFYVTLNRVCISKTVPLFQTKCVKVRKLIIIIISVTPRYI